MLPTKKGRASKAPSISDDDPDAEVAEPIPSESDDSGSEFDPIEDSESDFVVETDEDDEEVMVKAAVKQSIRTAREDQERAAGLTSAGAGSSKSRAAPANKAAAMRAAATVPSSSATVRATGHWVTFGSAFLSAEHKYCRKVKCTLEKARDFSSSRWSDDAARKEPSRVRHGTPRIRSADVRRTGCACFREPCPPGKVDQASAAA